MFYIGAAPDMEIDQLIAAFVLLIVTTILCGTLVWFRSGFPG